MFKPASFLVCCAIVPISACTTSPKYTLVDPDNCYPSGRPGYQTACQKIDIETPNSETELCVTSGSGWRYRWNKYTLNAYGNFSVTPRPYQPRGPFYCKQRSLGITSLVSRSGKSIVENEFALVSYQGYSSGHANIFFTVEGKLCAPSPLINAYQIVYRPTISDQYIDYEDGGRMKRKPFVIPDIPESISFEDFERVVGVEPRIFFRLADLMKKQCGTVPTEIRLKGGYLVEFDNAIHGRFKTRKPEVIPIVEGSFKSDTIYLAALDGSAASVSREEYVAYLREKQAEALSKKMWRIYKREHNAAVGLGSLLFPGWLGIIWGSIPVK